MALIVLLSGCGGEGKVLLSAKLNGLPLANLEIVALPYNAERLLDSLERVAADPRPDFSELEAELQAYTRKDPDSVAALSSEWADARRAVADLADTLNAMGRGSAGYSRAYGRFRSAYDALSGREAELESRMRRELGSDRELALRAGAAADSLRRWEEEAYRDFPDLVAAYDEVVTTTDPAGHLTVTLEVGAWWLLARYPHPQNPFVEFAWSVPVVVSSLVPVVAPLANHNVTLRWRR